MRPSFSTRNQISPVAVAIPLPSLREESVVLPSSLDSISTISSSSSPRRKALSTTTFSIPTLASLSPPPVSSRPIRSFKGTSSSFLKSFEGLPLSAIALKALQETKETGPYRETIFAFYTTKNGVVWVELAPDRPKDALCRITFGDSPTCIDLNRHTATDSRLDVLVGFAGSDIFWFDPFVAKYSRFNKAGIICNSPVTFIKWLPPSSPASPISMQNDSNLFVSAHANGSMIIWDKDREDAVFVPSMPTQMSYRSGGKENDTLSTPSSVSSAPRSPLHKPPSPTESNRSIVTKSTTRFNPISKWDISPKSILAFAFSPDLSYWAVVGKDGCLRIIDVGNGILLDTFAGYFGALNCVAWSPDGRFVLTGGQDDLCSIYAPLEQRLIARCQGHSSFVRGVAWESLDELNSTRFATVAEDCQLMIWELSSLARPKAHHGPYNRHRSSSNLSRHRTTDSFHAKSLSHLSLAATRSTSSFHPSPRRAEVSVLQPSCKKRVSVDPLEDLYLLPGGKIVTLSRTGQIQLFVPEPEGVNGSEE